MLGLYVQCVKSTGADLQLCEKHLFIWCAVRGVGVRLKVKRFS